MTIIQAHKFYWRRDGASNYALDLASLLEERGHTVVPFAMQHPQNLKNQYERFFVSRMELGDASKLSLGQKMCYAVRMFYSFEAKRQIQKLLEKEAVDIIHLHNIYHHISPSILPVIKKKGIPIVMTLHDWKLICPNYSMFHHGAVHEEDCRGWYGTCVKNKCFRDSRMLSSIVRWEMVFHHKIMRYYERYVDRFIAPSRFIMEKCIEFGWPREKFVHIPLPVTSHKPRTTSHENEDGEYVAYVGRLSEEKGLSVLFEAAKMTPEILYKIIGEGPMKEMLNVQCSMLNLENVRLEGFQTGKKLQQTILGARIIVVPSVWYENYPLSVLEAKAAGKVVIASEIGGIPEMLPQELLVRPGDAKGLAKKIKTWYDAPFEKRGEMGDRLRKEAGEVNDQGRHLQAILAVYAEVTKHINTPTHQHETPASPSPPPS